MRDDSLLLILVPELAQVTQERYNILHQISLLSPVGRIRRADPSDHYGRTGTGRGAAKWDQPVT